MNVESIWLCVLCMRVQRRRATAKAINSLSIQYRRWCCFCFCFCPAVSARIMNIPQTSTKIFRRHKYVLMCSHHTHKHTSTRTHKQMTGKIQATFPISTEKRWISIRSVGVSMWHLKMASNAKWNRDDVRTHERRNQCKKNSALKEMYVWYICYIFFVVYMLCVQKNFVFRFSSSLPYTHIHSHVLAVLNCECVLVHTWRNGHWTDRMYILFASRIPRYERGKKNDVVAHAPTSDDNHSVNICFMHIACSWICLCHFEVHIL